MSLYTVQSIRTTVRINDLSSSKGGGPMDERGDEQAMAVDFQMALDSRTNTLLAKRSVIATVPRRGPSGDGEASHRSTDTRETAVS